MEDVNEIKESVEDLASEEQEKFDNMPEGLQNGSTGQSVQDAATALESVIDNLSEAINAIEQAVDDAINAIM
jgi:molecular chaperone GrpE (heat shock protein)